MFWLGVLLFFIAVATDVVWARYTLNLTSHNRVRASNYAVLITIAAMFSYVGYHKSLWLTIPLCAGCWVGTYLSSKKKPE